MDFLKKNVSLTKTQVSDLGPYSPKASVFVCIRFFFMFVWTNFLSPAYIINKLFNGYNKAIELLYS